MVWALMQIIQTVRQSKGYTQLSWYSYLHYFKILLLLNRTKCTTKFVQKNSYLKTKYIIHSFCKVSIEFIIGICSTEYHRMCVFCRPGLWNKGNSCCMTGGWVWSDLCCILSNPSIATFPTNKEIQLCKCKYWAT